jgi:uncharacterized protein (DUF427 family)
VSTSSDTPRPIPPSGRASSEPAISDTAASGPARESVWDYPRPPRVEPSSRRVRIVHAGIVVADSRRAVRVLETSHPPAWYIPPEDVRLDLLVPSARRTVCEYKGVASYLDLRAGEATVRDACWSYPQPRGGYETIAGHLAFYPGRVDEAWVDDERVLPQAGDFYGGWITSDVLGPFKGGPGTLGW